jgi:hypothetical protein
MVNVPTPNVTPAIAAASMAFPPVASNAAMKKTREMAAHRPNLLRMQPRTHRNIFNFSLTYGKNNGEGMLQ